MTLEPNTLREDQSTCPNARGDSSNAWTATTCTKRTESISEAGRARPAIACVNVKSASHNRNVGAVAIRYPSTAWAANAVRP